MIRIHIAYEVSPEAVFQVERFLEETKREDVDFNGAEFSIERDDFTFVGETTVDGYDTDRLFQGIQRIIRGESA